MKVLLGTAITLNVGLIGFYTLYILSGHSMTIPLALLGIAILVIAIFDLVPLFLSVMLQMKNREKY